MCFCYDIVIIIIIIIIPRVLSNPEVEVTTASEGQTALRTSSIYMRVFAFCRHSDIIVPIERDVVVSVAMWVFLGLQGFLS